MKIVVLNEKTQGRVDSIKFNQVVKKMVGAHGGEVWFESEENVGTTFYVSIPRE